MHGFVERVVLRRRVLIPAAVALMMLLVWVEFPAASVDPYQGSSSSGACDILLLGPPRTVEQLAESWQPGRVLREMRAAALTDSIRRVLARYPRYLQPDEQAALAEMLLTEGERHGIDPLFLAAVIRIESAFSKDAISNKGARGLMQVMPATGEEMAQRLGLAWSGPNGLHDPEVNIRLGSFYLRQLLDRYQGNYKRALTAYNRGPRNLRYIEQRHGGLGRQFTGYFRKIQQIYRTYQRSLGAGGALLQVG
jgi:soluble lytic murein transglycosylase-like protein